MFNNNYAPSMSKGTAPVTLGNWGQQFGNSILGTGEMRGPNGMPNPLPGGLYGIGNSDMSKIMGNRNLQEAYRKRPYGEKSPGEGGGQAPVDWFRRTGRDVGNPRHWMEFSNMVAGMKGPWNPKGKGRSPYPGFISPDHPEPLYMMNPIESGRYSVSRYGGRDTGLRSPFEKEKSTIKTDAELNQDNWNLPPHPMGPKPYKGPQLKW